LLYVGMTQHKKGSISTEEEPLTAKERHLQNVELVRTIKIGISLSFRGRPDWLAVVFPRPVGTTGGWLPHATKSSQPGPALPSFKMGGGGRNKH
jgi:hypothetical protein